jgi:hypothetical protein
MTSGTAVRTATGTAEQPGGPGSGAGPGAGSGAGPGSGAAAGAGAGAGPGGPGPEDLSSALEVVAAFVASLDASCWSGPDAASLLDRFTRLKRLAATGEALCASRAAEAHRPEAGGFPTPMHWLAGRTGESLGQSAGVLRLGGALGEDGPMAQACRDGQLSSPAATLVAEAVSVNPGAEAELVRAARTATLRQLKDRCLKAKADARSHEDRAARDRRIHAERHCRTWTDRDGAFRLDARLTPGAGASLLASLTAQAEEGFTEARRTGDHQSPDALRADALVALVTGVGLAGVPDGGDHPRRPPAQVILRVDLALLRGDRPIDGTGTQSTDAGVCEIPGVGPVPLETARALLGDALCTLVVTDGVDVTTVCTLGRSVPHALKVALMERDRCCVVPGCDATEHLEIDHWRIPFAEGGPASLDNLARLCRHHHQLRTHRGFTLTKDGTTWHWAPPTGGQPKDPGPKDPGPDGTRTHPPGPEPGQPGQPGQLPELTNPALFSLDE